MPKIIEMEPVRTYRARQRALDGLGDNLDTLKEAGSKLVANSGYIILGVLGALLVSHMNEQDEDNDEDSDEGEDTDEG